MATTLTVNRMLLGQEIRHLIEQVAKITQGAAGELIRTGQSRIGNVISGEGTLKYAELDMLIDKISKLPNVDPDDAAAMKDPTYLEWLTGLIERGKKRGFWQSGHFRAIHEDFRRWVGVEQRADQLRFVDSVVLPDILQTEEYMRALFSARAEDLDATLDEYVQARLARQEVLDSDTECHVVISESCVHTEPFGLSSRSGADIMCQQITHLGNLSKRSNVLIQIMPFKAPAPGVGGTQAMCLPFQIARVPSRGLAGPLEIAMLRSPWAIHYADDKGALADCERTWSRLAAAALGPDQTRKYLKTLANLLYQ